ncbi:hypothetical protein FG05_35218 [Fusarium graminearum]|nr:hypothetical protein FG05_35218 [Fusarium graminearum]
MKKITIITCKYSQAFMQGSCVKLRTAPGTSLQYWQDPRYFQSICLNSVLEPWSWIAGYRASTPWTLTWMNGIFNITEDKSVESGFAHHTCFRNITCFVSGEPLTIFGNADEHYAEG